MAEINTDSYPKPQQGQNPLDIAGKLQGLQSNAIGIDQQKLALANQHFEIVNHTLGSLLYDPDLNHDKIINKAQELTNLGLMTPDHQAEFVSHVPLDSQGPDAQRKFITSIRDQALSNMEALNWYGNKPAGFITQGPNAQYPVSSQQGVQKITPGVVPPALPATQPEFKPNIGRPGVVGAPPGPAAPYGFPGQAPALPQTPMMGGAVSGATPVQTSTVRKPALITSPPSRLPLQPQQGQPASVTDKINAGTNIPPGSGEPPMFSEGKQQYLTDQNNAKTKLESLRPAIIALSKMDDLRSGPGTPTFNRGVAFLKTWGVIPTQTPNDSTAVYQEVDKYLHQFLKGRGGRSDADLTAAEQSSPNLGLQINPALVDLTKNAIAQDRTDAGLPGAFKGVKFDKYGEHRSNYAASQDLRAAQLDLMKPDERKSLLDEMKTKQNTEEGKRFWNTLKNLRSQQIVNPPAQ